MKTFTSPVQVLLTLKDRQERNAFQLYMRALQSVERIQEQIRNVDWELENLEHDWQGRIAVSCSSTELQLVQAAIEFQRQRRLDLQGHLNQTRKAADSALHQWMAAKQALELFEAHLQKQKKRHYHREQKNEQKKLDNIPSRRLAARLSRLQPKALEMN